VKTSLSYFYAYFYGASSSLELLVNVIIVMLPSTHAFHEYTKEPVPMVQSKEPTRAVIQITD